MRDTFEGDAEVVELCDAVDHVFHTGDRDVQQHCHTKTATPEATMARAAACRSFD